MSVSQIVLSAALSTAIPLSALAATGDTALERLFIRYKEFRLWDQDAPLTTPEDAARKEHFNDKKGGGFNRLSDVTVPTVTCFPVNCADPRPAVIVCPGGGYNYLAWEHEGIEVCNWLNTLGYHAFLLKYRCPQRRDAAFADAARAIRFVRANAARFNVNGKVGIIGFSAGGHLSATVSAPGDRKPYAESDEIDRHSFRPDFAMLIYPAYLADKDFKVKAEFTVDNTVPPTFIVQTQDDTVKVECGLFWYWALKQAGVPAELHLFPDGGHGYSLHRKNLNVSNWPALTETWLKQFR